jgi:hypothetical protein
VSNKCTKQVGDSNNTGAGGTETNGSSNRTDSADSDDSHRLYSPSYASSATIDLLHVAEHNTDGIVVFDSEGRYLFVNLEASAF